MPAYGRKAVFFWQGANRPLLHILFVKEHTMLKQYLEAGRIVATHGIRGEVRMEPWCDSAEFIRPLRRFYRADGSVMEVESSRVHKGMLLVKFKGVDTATQGDLLRGVVLSLDRNDVSLPQGRYFVQDLLGASVQDANSGRVYGKIEEIFQTAASDVYRVRDEAGKDHLLPAVEAMLVSTDVEAGQVLVRPVKGIFDDED